MKVILWLSLALVLAAQPPEPDAALAPLLHVRRVFVETLGGGEPAAHFRDMLIASLQASRLFVLTENPDKADTVLRGSAEDIVFTDTFSSSDGLQARSQIGSSKISGSTRGGLGVSIGEQESTRIAERKHEASASVRLVNRDGDVIWSTTQESLGGKFRGASADVAGKITRQLADDVQRSRRQPPVAPVN